MDQEENQLEFFLKTIKKCLSNICNHCIDEICDSALRKVLLLKVEPGKKIETYLRLISEKRIKIQCYYQRFYEEENDNEDIFNSDNNSNFSDFENCGKLQNKEIKNVNIVERINKVEILPTKKNKGNKKKKKKNTY